MNASEVFVSNTCLEIHRVMGLNFAWWMVA
jgi:hypothetical protein